LRRIGTYILTSHPAIFSPSYKQRFSLTAAGDRAGDIKRASGYIQDVFFVEQPKDAAYKPAPGGNGVWRVEFDTMEDCDRAWPPCDSALRDQSWLYRFVALLIRSWVLVNANIPLS
jgi:hypothetical protein